MFLNNKELITKAVEQQPFDTTGNHWQPKQILELLERGELASFAKEEEKYFIYQRQGKTPPRYELTDKPPLKAESVAPAVELDSDPQPQIVWKGGAISSEDPNALPLLKSKLDRLQQKQERMKQATKLAKKGDSRGRLCPRLSPRESKAANHPPI